MSQYHQRINNGILIIIIITHHNSGLTHILSDYIVSNINILFFSPNSPTHVLFSLFHLSHLKTLEKERKKDMCCVCLQMISCNINFND